MRRTGRLLRWARGCPPGWQISRAVSESDSPLLVHIQACPRCSVEYRRLRAVAVRAVSLAASDGMSHETTQAISARLLGGASRAPARPRPLLRRSVWMGAVGLASLAVALGVFGWARRTRHGEAPAPTSETAPGRLVEPTRAWPPTPASRGISAPQSHASIRALDAARFSRVTPPPDERILLQEGVIALDVVPLPPGERFRVIADDAEVEVRGTHFTVSAWHGRLASVRVASGRVEVKTTGGALATLDAGDEWMAGVSVADRSQPVRREAAARPIRTKVPPGSAPARAGAGSSGAAPSAAALSEGDLPATPAPSGAPRPREERRSRDGKRSVAAAASFDSAWSLLRKGDTRAAAAAFADVERVAAGESLEEDAAYWHAVAVARSGDPAQARRLFGEFLRRFPASARRGEASVAVGWLLLEAGQLGDARVAFERALSDPSAPVRASAREGLGRAAAR